MLVYCHGCGVGHDDEHRSTICPHNKLFSYLLGTDRPTGELHQHECDDGERWSCMNPECDLTECHETRSPARRIAA